MEPKENTVDDAKKAQGEDEQVAERTARRERAELEQVREDRQQLREVAQELCMEIEQGAEATIAVRVECNTAQHLATEKDAELIRLQNMTTALEGECRELELLGFELTEEDNAELEELREDREHLCATVEVVRLEYEAVSGAMSAIRNEDRVELEQLREDRQQLHETVEEFRVKCEVAEASIAARAPGDVAPQSESELARLPKKS